MDISAAGLILKAGNGIGSGANHLETSVATLSVSSGAGGAFVTETDALAIGSLTVAVNRVAGDASFASAVTAAQEDLSASGAGSLVLITGGDLTVNQGTAGTGGISTVSGNVLLSVTGSLALNAALNAGSGNVSLVSSAAMSFDASGDISTSGTGTVDVRSGASISMADGTVTTAAGGNIRYAAAGTLTLGALSTGASVSLSASSITDSGTSETDITATQLRLITTGASAGQGAGTSGNHLEINVSMLAADVKGTDGLYVTEADGLVIGTLGAINVNQVAMNGTVSVGSQTADAAQANLVSAGNLVLVTTNGSLATLAGGGAVSAAGNLLLSAGGASSDLTLGAAVLNTAGHTSLSAGRSIVQNAGITASGLAMTVELEAVASITMADGTVIQTNGGAVRVKAGGDITVGQLDARVASDRSGSSLTDQATWGAVSIVSTGGSILDNAGESVSGNTDVYASELRLSAAATAGGIGQSGNHLESEAARVSAQTGTGGLYLTEATALAVGQTAAVTVNRVRTDGTVTGSTQVDAAQSGLVSAGNLVLVTTGGSLATLAVGGAISGSGQPAGERGRRGQRPDAGRGGAQHGRAHQPERRSAASCRTPASPPAAWP